MAIDPADGAGLSWLYRHAEVLSKGMRDDGLLGGDDPRRCRQGGAGEGEVSRAVIGV